MAWAQEQPFGLSFRFRRWARARAQAKKLLMKKAGSEKGYGDKDLGKDVDKSERRCKRKMHTKRAVRLPRAVDRPPLPTSRPACWGVVGGGAIQGLGFGNDE